MRPAYRRAARKAYTPKAYAWDIPKRHLRAVYTQTAYTSSIYEHILAVRGSFNGGKK